MSTKRFRAKTVTQLAQQVAYRCSHCDKTTIGPTKDNEDKNLIGEAAHINGLNPGSKRFNPNLSLEEKNSIKNGIWLCSACHKIIDSDNSFTVEIVQEIKARSLERAWLRLTGNNPSNDLTYTSINIEKFFSLRTSLGIYMEATPMNNVQTLVDEISNINSEFETCVIDTLVSEENVYTNELDELILFFSQVFKATLGNRITKTNLNEFRNSLSKCFTKIKNYKTLSQHINSLLDLQHLLTDSENPTNYFISPKSILNQEVLNYLIDPVKCITKIVSEDLQSNNINKTVVIVKSNLDFPIQIFEACKNLMGTNFCPYYFIFCVEPLNILKFPPDIKMFHIKETLTIKNSSTSSYTILNKYVNNYFERKPKLFHWLSQDSSNQTKGLIFLALSYELDQDFLDVVFPNKDMRFILEEIETDQTGLRRLPLEICKAVFSSYSLDSEVKRRIEELAHENPFQKSFYNVLVNDDFVELDVQILANSRKPTNLMFIMGYVKRLCYISDRKKELRNRYSVIRSFLKNDFFDLSQQNFLDNLVENHSLSKVIVSEVLYIKAFSLYKLGNTEKSMDFLYKSYDNNERNVPALCLLAFLLFEKGQRTMALEMLDEAISLKNNYEFAHYYKGVIFESIENFEEAIYHYTRALLINHCFYECTFNLINCLLELKCYSKAINLADFSITLANEYEPFYNIVPALAENGNISLAKEILQILHGMSSDPILNFNHAIIDAKMNNRDGVKSHLLKVIKNTKNAGLMRKSQKLYQDVAKMSFRDFRRKHRFAISKVRFIDHSSKYDYLLGDTDINIWVKQNSQKSSSILDVIQDEENFKRELQRLKDTALMSRGSKLKKPKNKSRGNKTSKKNAFIQKTIDLIIEKKLRPKKMKKSVELGSGFSKVPSYSGG